MTPSIQRVVLFFPEFPRECCRVGEKVRVNEGRKICDLLSSGIECI